MKAIEIISNLYNELSSNLSGGVIPIQLRPSSLVGTVQDDPFDSWVGNEICQSMPDIEVFHAGKLTTPDIILRDPISGTIIGLEVKKLIQQENGTDPRGLTMDFNSCLPCGKALIKVGNDTVEIPCFYLFALLSPDSSSMVTTIIMDGDFLNYDFDLHKDAKYANQSEYKHSNSAKTLQLDKLPVRRDIFKSCKNRKPKARTASMPHLPIISEEK